MSEKQYCRKFELGVPFYTHLEDYAAKWEDLAWISRDEDGILTVQLHWGDDSAKFSESVHSGLVGLALGRLLLPVLLPIRAVVYGAGRGDGLEQTVKGLLWLRRAGLWRGRVIIEDRGLDREGLLLARMLARQDGVEFTLK